jgi:hypothetical protein
VLFFALFHSYLSRKHRPFYVLNSPFMSNQITRKLIESKTKKKSKKSFPFFLNRIKKGGKIFPRILKSVESSQKKTRSINRKPIFVISYHFFTQRSRPTAKTPNIIFGLKSAEKKQQFSLELRLLHCSKAKCACELGFGWLA